MKNFVWAAVVMAALMFNSGIAAQAQNGRKMRKSIPESKLELPEYFGLYAVRQSGEMLVLEDTVKSLYELPKLALPADVEFLFFDQDGGTQINLLLLPATKGQEEAPRPLRTSRDFMAEALEGGAKDRAKADKVPIGSKKLKILVKPVSAQKQMLRLIPSGFLPDGIYQIGSGSWWVRFVVGKVPADWKNNAAQDAAGAKGASSEGTTVEALVNKTVTILKGEDNVSEFSLAARSKVDFSISVNSSLNDVRAVLLDAGGYAKWEQLAYKSSFLGRTTKNVETITGPCPELLKKDVEMTAAGNCTLPPGKYYMVFYDGYQGYKEDVNQVGFPVKLLLLASPVTASKSAANEE